MTMVNAALLFFLLVFNYNVLAEFSCVQLDYLYQSHDCCANLGSNVPCLNSIPKTNFDEMVQETRDTIKNIEDNFLPRASSYSQKFNAVLS